MGEHVQLHEYVHPDACIALYAFGYQVALCPTCALMLDVLNRDRSPALPPKLYVVPG
jgi:hypothetical protein